MDSQQGQQTNWEWAVSFAHKASFGMPSSIKQVADFLLAEGTGIASLTMGEIAARAYTSKPTLVRFAKQAGYSGWRDYRHDFLLAMERIEGEQAQRAKVDVNYPFGASSSPSDAMDGIAHIYQMALRETIGSISETAISQAATSIVAARDVAYLGVMQNYHRGRVFASNLGLIGILCRVPGSEDVAPLVRRFTKGDCVVAASYSGELRHMPMNFIPELKRRGVTVVAVTNSERSDLAEVSDHVLAFAPLEHYHDKVASFYSGACTSLILDALYANCYLKRFEESHNSKLAILEGLGDRIPGDFPWYG